LKKRGYTVKPFPATRAGIVATISRARNKNVVHSLLEFDVTEARQFVKQQRKNGRASFKAFMMQCVARAAMMFPEVHSMRRGRKHYFFDHIDIATIFEDTVEGHLQVVPGVLTNVEKKSIHEITAELEDFKATEVNRTNMVMGKPGASLLTRLFMKLPQFLQQWTFNFLLGNPLRAQRMMGSIMFSNLSPFIDLSAWGIPLTMHPVNVLPGPIVKKPVVHNGEIAIRSILNLTISFDHDVVDGAQMSRFVNHLASLIENPTK